MKAMNAISRLIFIFISLNLYSQNKTKDVFESLERVPYEKDTIYMLFERKKNFKEPYKGIKFYSKEEKGTIFNDTLKGSFIFKNTSISDTINIVNLSNYNITNHIYVDNKTNEFQEKYAQKLPLKRNQKLYKFYNKNDIFQTYLIEILDNKFVVYPVLWRNQRASEINTRYKKN